MSKTGLKCFGHPVGAGSIRMTCEIFNPLRQKVDNPERQVKNPRLGPDDLLAFLIRNA